ncbi:hypothetical protein ENH_00008080 [Eimeria necatrix]|uniref:Uncharacterized protein n=1 Tax=Eimeria necatrix TaxID=51315 RepID=U6MT48_9EIME|nr:hypothetical protein ENH_00008080 [Eimeria necatrix]CDJ65619.1 hypothetical protein ENH_00008080 [Eimeria necatrix]
MSVGKMPSGTPAHHRHATPKPTVAERLHGHKEAPPQVIPMANIIPGDSPFVTWDQFQSAMSVIRTAIDGTGESGATFPILPEDDSTMQAFLLRIERRYTQMGLGPCEWGSAFIDHLVGPALTYWMYLRRTIDLSDRATVQRRLLERFDKTMSQSQLLTELAKVKYQSWEQAATAAARLYEPKQSVLELRERTSRAIRAAIQANGPQRGARKSKTDLGEPMRTPMSVRVAGIRHVPAPARENVPNVRGKYTRSVAVWDTMLGTVLRSNAIPVFLEWGNQLLSTAEGTNTSDGHAEATPPLSETRWESRPASILSEAAPGATTASSRKSAGATEDGYRPDTTEIALHWWRETCTKEPYDQRGALHYLGATAVLRVELAVSPCEAFLDTWASWSFISPKTVERLQLKSYVNGQWCELPVVRMGEQTLQGDSHIVAPPTTPAEQAYDILAKQVAGISAEEAAIFLRPPPKRYKSHAKTTAKAWITSLVRQAAAEAKSLRAPLHGLHYTLALTNVGSSVALRFTDEWQGALCCTLMGQAMRQCNYALSNVKGAVNVALHIITSLLEKYRHGRADSGCQCANNVDVGSREEILTNHDLELGDLGEFRLLRRVAAGSEDFKETTVADEVICKHFDDSNCCRCPLGCGAVSHFVQELSALSNRDTSRRCERQIS